MKTLPVALQVYSVRDDAQKDFVGTMQKIKTMGYDGVELAGLYGMGAKEIRKILDDVGLVAISAHVPYLELTNDAVTTIDAYVTLGCSYIAIPYLDEATRPGAEQFPKVLVEIERIAVLCKERGIVLLYHNHDFEFIKMPDGSYGLDFMYQTIPASLLQTEIDTCWVKVAGENPHDYIVKYTDRAPVVHLKDFTMDGAGGVGNRDNFSFKPVGHGLQDIPSILDASIKANAAWVVVEQDSSLERPALDAALMSREYLRSKGW